MAIGEAPQIDYWDLPPSYFNSQGYHIRPLWITDFTDDDAILQWVKSSVPVLKELSRDFSENVIENLVMYKGASDFSNFDPDPYARGRGTSKSPQISVNFCYEFTDVWVNRMSQYKAKISVLPKNNDSSARQDAKMKQLAIDDSFAKAGIDLLLQQFQLYARIMGEAYILVTWDKNAGSNDPEFEKANKKNQKIYITSPNGEKIPIEREVKIGEIKYTIIEPYRVLFPLTQWKDNDYVVIVDYVEPEKVATDYPNHEVNTTGVLLDGKMEVLEIYHKPTRYLPKGRYLKVIEGAVLENTVFPYSHKKIPLSRLTDIDVPTQVRGKSFLDNIKTQQVLTNKVMGASWRGVSIGSHPKIIASKNSVNRKDLANQSNIIEYSGATPPRLERYQGIGMENFQFMELMRGQAEKMARLQGITLGTPPPNVRSGLQVAQLEEQQQRAVTFDITKRNLCIEEIANLGLSTMADFYKEEDGRLLRIVGKDKGHLVRALNVKALQGEHLIEIKNNNALPEGKYEKLSMLVEMRNTFGNEIVPDSLVLDAFEIGQISRYTDYATKSVEKAESENEEMLDGLTPPSPESYDDHINEWKIHVSALRSRSFADTTDDVKSAFKSHILTHEYLMEQHAIVNKAFQAKLQMLDGFPVFYTLTPMSALPLSATQPTAPLPPETSVQEGSNQTAPAMVDNMVADDEMNI